MEIATIAYISIQAILSILGIGGVGGCWLLPIAHLSRVVMTFGTERKKWKYNLWGKTSVRNNNNGKIGNIYLLLLPAFKIPNDRNAFGNVIPASIFLRLIFWINNVLQCIQIIKPAKWMKERMPDVQRIPLLLLRLRLLLQVDGPDGSDEESSIALYLSCNVQYIVTSYECTCRM